VSKTLEKKWIEEAVSEVPNGFSGTTAWQSPSNIALVKYWGKHGLQLPNNPSVSLTLSASKSETNISFQRNDSGRLQLKFFFEDKENPAFAEKIQRFLNQIASYFPFLNQLSLTISSSNTFPHSSGIASSASAMSALVMGVLAIENKLKNTHKTDLIKASYFSRLGSGSASRSVFPVAAVWGKTTFLAKSSDEFAIPVAEDLHPIFQDFYDSILIIDSGTKAVSSRAGHALMDNNPFAPARYEQAHQNMQQIYAAMQSGDLDTFIRITEAEALQLHALMMTSDPGYILMQPNSLAAIHAIRSFRQSTQTPLCFTLDAGPNIHLLYPASAREKVLPFIEKELLPLCAHSFWIDDKVGQGASAI
jgi:diphosphomevalonate decarboxylase